MGLYRWYALLMPAPIFLDGSSLGACRRLLHSLDCFPRSVLRRMNMPLGGDVSHVSHVSAMSQGPHTAGAPSGNT